MADVNVMQSVACPVDRYPNDFKWAGKGMYAYDGNPHSAATYRFTSGIPGTDMVAECNKSFISNLRITREEPNWLLLFDIAQNAGPGGTLIDLRV